MKNSVALICLIAGFAHANEFAFKLYGQLSQTKGNLFFSPASIEAALAMVAEGAKGRTLEQLDAALPQCRCFPSIGSSVVIENANAIWVDRTFPILGSFEEAVTKKYGAKFSAADFRGQPEAERKEINNWVEQKTREKIKNLLPEGSVDAGTKLALINAIYFKGDWLKAFDPKQTRNEHFQTLENGSVDVPMMQMREAHLAYGENDFFQTLELPYKGEELSMLLILPKGTNELSDLSDLPKTRKAEVNVFVPRFKIESTFPTLQKELSALGLTDAFSAAQADFSGISTQPLFISDAAHKAFVEVNEEGTEAAAATGMMMRVTSIGPPPKVFRADRPFCFLILHYESQKILFMGRVNNPSK